MPLLPLLALFLCTSVLSAQITVDRGGQATIDLQTGQIAGTSPFLNWGPTLDRDADHATVAANDSGDIVVVFESIRGDYRPQEPAYEQVEMAYFEYIPGATPAQDSWELLSHQLLGSIKWSPLDPPYDQPRTRCEHPDVRAVGDQFFVAWTRVYDRAWNPPVQREEPSVLECVWVEKVGGAGGTVEVNNGGVLPNGQGFELDSDYYVRDCSGLPDIVVLDPPAGGDPTVAVLYPRQIGFGDYSNDTDRVFEIVITTCSVDAGGVITSAPPYILHNDIVFNGPASAGGGSTGAMINPNTSESSIPNSIWLTYEQQWFDAPTGVDIGPITLEYWRYNPNLPVPWFIVGGKTAAVTPPNITYLRRRPKIATFPVSGFLDEVSITFAYLPPAPRSDKDFIYRQFEVTGGRLRPFDFLGGSPVNTTADDHRSLPVHGPASPYLRRCYFHRGGSGLMVYDGGTGLESQVSLGTPRATRAAADYKLVGGAQTVPVTWEDELFAGTTLDHLRIVLMID